MPHMAQNIVFFIVEYIVRENNALFLCHPAKASALRRHSSAGVMMVLTPLIF